MRPARLRLAEVGQLLSPTEQYYLNGEKYDWVTDPRRLERRFHQKRSDQIVQLFHQTFTPHLRREALFLDLGCGTGLISRQLVATRLICADLNRWNLQRARQRTPSYDYVQCSAHALPFVQRFSGALITEVLEHLERPWEAASELSRVIRPGGILIGSVPSRSLVWKLRRLLSTSHPHSEPFHHNYTKKQLFGLLNGFRTMRAFRSVYGMSIVFVARTG